MLVPVQNVNCLSTYQLSGNAHNLLFLPPTSTPTMRERSAVILIGLSLQFVWDPEGLATNLDDSRCPIPVFKRGLNNHCG